MGFNAGGNASAIRAREDFMQSRENWAGQRVPRKPMDLLQNQAFSLAQCMERTATPKSPLK